MPKLTPKTIWVHRQDGTVISLYQLEPTDIYVIHRFHGMDDDDTEDYYQGEQEAMDAFRAMIREEEDNA